MLASALLILPIAIAGDLHFADVRDPITDQARIIAELGGDRGGLGVGCVGEHSGKLMVLIIYDHFVGNTRAGLIAGGTRVEYRFDDAPPLTTRGDAIKNSVRFTPSDSARFLASLRASGKLTVRAIDPRGAPHDAAFTYTDTTGAVPRMIDRCGFDAAGGR